MKPQIIKLSEIKTGTIFYGIAKAMIEEHGYYTCKFEGKKTKVIR